MLKKFMALFLFLLVFSSHNLFAAEIEEPGSFQRKLQRGFLNIVLSPIEIPHAIKNERKKELEGMNWMFGIVKGTVFTVRRAVVGAYEFLTSPFPVPAGYAPILEPEFAWQHYEE